MKRFFSVAILIFGIVTSFAFGSFLLFSEKCDNVQQQVLRLHIPANSDSAADQSIKLAVRDYILQQYGELLSECQSLDEAEEKVQQLLPEIENSAALFLSENGFDYSASAQLVTMHFTTREYDELILPAGEYRALQITLGSGEGHNWWCVIFPQLCLPCASQTQYDSSESAEYADCAENILDTFGKPQKVKIKFAVYELFSKIAD